MADHDWKTVAMVTWASLNPFTHKAQGQVYVQGVWGLKRQGGDWTEVLQVTSKGSRVAAMFLLLLSWRRCCSAVIDPHLLPGRIGLSVQDGTQASETSVRPRLNTVSCGHDRLRRGRLHWTDIVCGFVRSSSSEVSQVGESQFLWLG